MKSAVYSWRVSTTRKAMLEDEARRRGTSVAEVLEQITADWFAENSDGNAEDDAEQALIRQRAMAAIGSIRGGDPTRSARASELAGDMIRRKHEKEARANRPD